MVKRMIESMKRRRMDEIRFQFMGRRVRILIGILRDDRIMIGVT